MATADGRERLVADPTAVLGGEGEGERPLTPEERARRERARETASGIVSYTTDRTGRRVVFELAAQAWIADLGTGEVRCWPTAEPVFDARPEPGGRRVAYVAGNALRCVDEDGADRLVAADDDPDVSWGSAEFVAAEEMDRTRGYWWSPDGERLAVARVDVSPVTQWWISDPSDPAGEPRAIRYPAAGTDNAEVSLFLIALADGGRTEVQWDREALPYLADVTWDPDEGLLVVVQARDQRRVELRAVDVATGATTLRRAITDPAWVELVPGSPTWWQGRLLTVADHAGTRRLFVDDDPVTGDDLWVRGIAGTGDGGAWFTASTDPTGVDAYVFDGSSVRRHSDGSGIHGVAVGGGVVVVTAAGMDRDGATVTVERPAGAAVGLVDASAPPGIEPNVSLLRLGSREIATAVLLPTGHDPGSGPLPVLCDPYGGPHAQRVLRTRSAYLVSQWFADQGFAVLIADGRSTPGRGADWERAVHGDLAGPVLEDQVDALLAADAAMPGVLDLDRVAIRGWSFGGYLAALAVLRRPDVFAAAVAGAPVTDWALYDTHYTERYLGRPDEHPENYRATSLLHDAAALRRPLMLVHGLADDNVVAAHTLQLSAALLEAGRPHTVLPLLRVTHMTPQEVVAENLLLLQLDFLRTALGLEA
jgi:dipeptidyl-peptidase-4